MSHRFRAASRTGPMFPFSVESKVEQYLKYSIRAPWAFSQEKAAMLRSTASPGGQVLVFSAMTTAWASKISSSSLSGIPLLSITFAPPA